MKMSDELAIVLLPYLGVENVPHSLIVTVNVKKESVNVLCDSFEFETAIDHYQWHEKLIELNVIQSDQIYTSYTLVLVANEPAKILTSQFVI